MVDIKKDNFKIIYNIFCEILSKFAKIVSIETTMAQR